MTMALAKAKTGVMLTDEAVFSETEIGGKMVTVYFTPTATDLAKLFDAVPCEKPTPTSQFSLLAGDQRAWGIHFPDDLEKRQPGVRK